MSLVDINWKPSPEELRKNGFWMLLGFGVLGLITWYKGEPTASYVLWGIGLAGGLTGLTGTRIALPMYYAWMGVAFVLGSVMGRVVMTLMYLLVVTPVGLLMHLSGRDPLQIQKPTGETYWRDIEQPADKDRYERQF